MLKPKEIESLPENLIELYSQLEQEILKDMSRRISTYDYYIPAAQWQYKKIVELGNFNSTIVQTMSAYTGKTEQEIKYLMEDAGVKTLKLDDSIYKAAGLKVPPLAASPALLDVLDAGIKNTNGLFKNLTKTTAQTATKQFENTLDRAYMQVISGAFDHNTAVRNAIKGLSVDGIQAITYPSGSTSSIETAARRAVVTGVNQTALKLQEERANEMGCDLVETTAHGGARPDHAMWQGKVFSRSGKSKKYPDFVKSTGYGTGAGLGGWNCSHSFYPFFEGISHRAYTDTDLKDYNAKKYTYNGESLTEYEASQIQRRIERNIRRWKREDIGMGVAGLPTNEAASKVKSWQERQKDFIRQTGLKRQRDREQIGTYSHAEAAKTRIGAEKHYQTWINSISNEGNPKTLVDYYDMKYNDHKEYEMLKGYTKAVEKGDISPLIGFKVYKDTAKEVEEKLLGLSVAGTEMKDYSTHFIDRIIGQTSTSHTNMREGVSVDKVREVLLDPLRSLEPFEIIMKNGKKDMRQEIIGTDCRVIISKTDSLFIQTNLKKGE